jgi:hypothetical protein
MADSYTVLDQRKTTEYLGGRFQDVWEVTYRTASGVVGNVRIPASSYTPEKVHEVIDAEVANVHAIGNL